MNWEGGVHDKKKGARTEPCGTPQKQIWREENLLSHLTSITRKFLKHGQKRLAKCTARRLRSFAMNSGVFGYNKDQVMSYHWYSKLGTDSFLVVGLGHLDNLYMAHIQPGPPKSNSSLLQSSCSPQLQQDMYIFVTAHFGDIVI